MAYFTVTRKYTITEQIIVKAESKYEAFQKAGDDVDCDIKSESNSDYEPDYNSIAKVRYVSQATIERIG